MSLESNSENRNANLPVRYCSFCRRGGHTINRCNSEPIRIFERNTLDYIYLILPLRLEGHPHLESLNHYLLDEALYDSNLVRAFAISRCGANTISNMAICIELITQYFMPIIQNIETNNQTIQEARGAEQAQQAEPARRGRRFGFSELSLSHLEMGGRTSIETESIIYAMMIIEMSRAINDSAQLNRKFHIKTKISEKQDDLEEEYKCNICYDIYYKQQFVKLDCGHEFCKDCIKQSLQNERRNTPCCAFCRADIKNFEVKKESIKNEFDELITNEIEP